MFVQRFELGDVGCSGNDLINPFDGSDRGVSAELAQLKKLLSNL
jgi:hypothetical protein